MFVPHKPHPFGNDYHTIACAKYKAIYNVETVEGKDRPRAMGKKESEEKGVMAGLMVCITKPLWGTGKVVVLDSDFCVLEGLLSTVEKGVLGSAFIKKRRYWSKEVPAEDIVRHMKNKEVGDLDAIQGSIIGESYHIMAIKEPAYVMLMMTTDGTLEHLEGSDTQQRYKGGGGGVVRSSGITSITGIKFTTTTIGAIFIFQLRGLGLQSIDPIGVMPTYWRSSYVLSVMQLMFLMLIPKN